MSGGAEAEAIASVFGRAAQAYDTVIPFFASFGARLVELARLSPGDRVLDVGCGRGATLVPAAERVGPGGRVLGVDLSQEMVDLLANDLRRRQLSNASVVRMDAGELQVDASSFDVVVSNFVLHLAADPERAAVGFLRALRRGGRCAVSAPIGEDPDWKFFGNLVRSFAHRASRPIAIPFRSDFDLETVIDGAGFERLQSFDEEIRFVFADEQAWWDWSWSHGMRSLFEALPSAVLEELRNEVFDELKARVTADGLALRHTARFVIATKAEV